MRGGCAPSLQARLLLGKGMDNGLLQGDMYAGGAEEQRAVADIAEAG